METLTLEELQRIDQEVGERFGWDFSKVQGQEDPASWDYLGIVKKYAKPQDLVLDIGTGGGEVFSSLAPYIGKGIGIDENPKMVETATRNLTPGLAEKLSYRVMNSEKLEFPDETFDLVLDRHAGFTASEVAQVLKKGGIFITQQVGANNLQNLFDIWGFGTNKEYWQKRGGFQELSIEAENFRSLGLEVLEEKSYDISYYLKDLNSLIFFLKALPYPFDPLNNLDKVNEFITKFSTPRGFQTNEQRDLLVVRK